MEIGLNKQTELYIKLIKYISEYNNNIHKYIDEQIENKFKLEKQKLINEIIKETKNKNKNKKISIMPYKNNEKFKQNTNNNNKKNKLKIMI